MVNFLQMHDVAERIPEIPPSSPLHADWLDLGPGGALTPKILPCPSGPSNKKPEVQRFEGAVTCTCVSVGLDRLCEELALVIPYPPFGD